MVGNLQIYIFGSKFDSAIANILSTTDTANVDIPLPGLGNTVSVLVSTFTNFNTLPQA